MRFIKLLVAILMSLVLLVDVTIGLIAYDLTRTVIEPAFYERALAEQGVYGVVLETALASADKAIVGAPADYKEKLLASLREGLTEDWLKNQVGAITGGLLAYLKGETSELALPVSTQELKEPVKRVLRAATTELPSKEAKQAGLLVNELEQLPDRYNLAENLEVATLSEARRYVGYLIKIPGYALGLAILTAVLLWLVAGRRGAAFRWVGMPLFLAGAVGIAMALVGTATGMAKLSGSNFQVVPQEILPVDTIALAANLLRQVTGFLTLAAGVVVAVSLVLMIIPAFFPRRAPARPESASDQA